MNDLDKKIKIIALFGESASGKDTIQKLLTEEYPLTFNPIISCTTRPKRDNEEEGVDYYYLTNEQFAENVLNGKMLEATSFNDWFYGTRLQELNKDKINVGVFNIEGIECLLQDNRLEVYPVYIYAADKIRLLRSLSREKNPNCHEICRRFLADEKDFDDIDFTYITFNNNFDSLIDITKLLNQLNIKII